MKDTTRKSARAWKDWTFNSVYWHCKALSVVAQIWPDKVPNENIKWIHCEDWIVRFISPSISCHILENHVIALFDWKCSTLLLIQTCCCGIPPMQSWLTVKEAANKICQQSCLFFPASKLFWIYLHLQTRFAKSPTFFPPEYYFGLFCICKQDLPTVQPFFLPTKQKLFWI